MMTTPNPRHQLIYARHRLPLAKAELESLVQQGAVLSEDDEGTAAKQLRIYIQERTAVLRAEMSELRPIVAQARAAESA